MSDTQALPDFSNEYELSSVAQVLRRSHEIDGHISIQAIDQNGDIDEELALHPDNALQIAGSIELITKLKAVAGEMERALEDLVLENERSIRPGGGYPSALKSARAALLSYRALKG